jgi:uncharacterized protein YcfJ
MPGRGEREAHVKNETLMIAISTAIGAVAGGVAGYFLLTKNGRKSLRAARPTLYELAHEIGDMKQSLHGVTDAVRSGRRLLDEFVKEDRPSSSFTH